MQEREVLGELWDVIGERAENPSAESYVSRILTHRKGVDKALEKVGEEAVEFIIAAKNGDDARTVSEGADLLFHFLLALKAANIDLADVLAELEERRRG
ncbi:phosphoribosyl-ATP diphosphatase [Methanoculleus sp. FWC-SCC1]|uniref:Phosphoribosyl-ATP pyrophosphatase n=1 Tax=Methanoculleus frigidifontis TaxID=2584085 RepID=A0ABT8M875_9EURY|nr:phosphoribosyl-ATP diphosphatase [Methanoculleus sp. FWC-SCC1]MDN7024133.1 phosphoribosyl-ATP diphosphatase [Methanoculleus sp. FWC-SCC1]